MLLGSFSFAVMGACIKYAAESEPHYAIVFWRNLFGLLSFIPIVWMWKGSLATQHIGGHICRSAFGLAAMYCFFYGLTKLPLADAILLSYTTPIFIPFVAFLWLRERVSWMTALAILIGFAGVVCVLSPGIKIIIGAHWIGLLAGALAAVAMVSIKHLSATEPSTRIVFYYCIICTLISFVPMISDWQTPELHVWPALIASGCFATLGQICLTTAYSLSSPADVGPWQYSTVVFAAIIGWLMWGEVLTVGSGIGALLIAIAGSLLLHMKKQKTN